MTIRRTLLISYLIISLASASLITLMIFTHLREMLHVKIENNLQSQANTLMRQVDTTLFERMKDLSIWQHLDVMQDLHVRDIDKRLADFFYELQAGYGGVYRYLFATDAQQEIIAASDFALIGQLHQPVPGGWHVDWDEHRITLEPLELTPAHLYFSVPVNDAFQQGDLGKLYAVIDWSQIISLLEAPLQFDFPEVPSYVLLLDADDRIIAMSNGLEGKLKRFSTLDIWSEQFDRKVGAFSVNAPFLEQKTVLVGYAHSQGHLTFAGFNWRVVIIQPTEYAFAQVSKLWGVLAVFVAITLLLSIFLSLWMSARFARPIVQLARFTKDFMTGKTVAFPTLNAQGEMAELSTQFAAMIDNLEQSRRDIVRVAKLAVIGEMAASMAHEVRTPLGILRSSAQMLQRESGLSEVGQEMTGFILSETQRLNQLVSALLDCARPRPPEFALQDLHRILEHAMQLLQTQAENKSITVTFSPDTKSAVLFCDKDQIIQVFLNLILNALQHIEPGGRIDLTVRVLDNEIETRVCDSGPGIPDHHKEKIFEPFFTRREQGMGLGLTVVQQIVLAHKGRIFVTDNHGGGACFHVVLPISIEESVTHD
jgi:signal transduction histidine kinase